MSVHRTDVAERRRARLNARGGIEGDLCDQGDLRDPGIEDELLVV